MISTNVKMNFYMEGVLGIVLMAAFAADSFIGFIALVLLGIGTLIHISTFVNNAISEALKKKE